MTVTEVHQGQGTWTVALNSEAPRQIQNQVRGGPYGLIRIYPVRIPVEGVDVVKPLYVGLATTSDDMATVGGVGLAYFLGEDGNDHTGYDDIGPWYPDLAAFGGDWTLTTWMTNLLAAMGGVFVAPDGGWSSTVAGSKPNEFAYRTARAILDWICATYQVAWRIDPDRTLNLIPQFPTAVKVIATPGGGRDGDWFGLDTGAIDPAIDWTAATRDNIAQVTDPDTGDATYVSALSFTPPANIFNDPAGNAFTPTQYTTGKPDVSFSLAGGAGFDASQIISPFEFTCPEYAVTQHVRPGDRMYVDLGVADPYSFGGAFAFGQPVESFRGRVIAPSNLPVSSIEWPVRQGMGVWFDNRHNGGPLVDLTEHVVYEQDTPTTVNVGAPKPTLGRILRRRR